MDPSHWIHPERVHLLSFELWGFLNTNLTGKAKQKFDNVQGFEGSETWRRTLKLVRDRAMVRKISLNDKVHRPDEAKRLADVPSALESWDKHVREFEEAGGKQLFFVDKKLAMINIIPSSLRADMMLRTFLGHAKFFPTTNRTHDAATETWQPTEQY